MNRQCKLSIVTRDYLTEFHCILDGMIHGIKSAQLSDSISLNFIAQMIPHHQGAVEMSENTLQYDICPELVPILEAIITSQKRGIRQMQQLLRCISA